MPKGQKNHAIREHLVVYELFRRDGAGTWHAKVRNTRNGKFRQKDLRTKSKQAARKAQEAWIKALLAEDADDIKPLLFEDAFERYIQSRGKLRSTTRYDYGVLKERTLAGFHGMKVKDIRASHVEAEFKKLEDKNIASITLKRYIKIFRSFIKWAQINDYYRKDIDPTESKRHIYNGNNVREKKALSIEEARNLLFFCKSNLRLAVLISLLTGLRRKNVYGLRWDQVDLDNKIIKINASEMKAGRDHTAPINNELAEALEQQRQKNMGEFVLGRKYRTMTEALNNAAKKAGYKLTWKDMRLSFASWLINLCSEPVRMAILGHVGNTVTLIHYTKVTEAEKLEAVNKIPILGKK